LDTDGTSKHAAKRVSSAFVVGTSKLTRLLFKTERERGMMLSSISSLSSPSCS